VVATPVVVKRPPPLPPPRVEISPVAPSPAHVERSDVCVVPAAGVVAEAMLAFVMAQAAIEKFGGDSLNEMKRNLNGYLQQIEARRRQPL